MKNKKQAYTIFLLITALVLFSNCRKEKIKPEQAESFIKYYGKAGNQKAGNVVAAADGGYVLVGTSDAYGDGTQILVVKTDAYGNEQWSKVFGGAGDDEGYNVLLADDGGYVIAGSKAESSGVNTNAWITKLSTDGSQIWEKEFGTAGKDESAVRVINTKTDGGYISVGTTTNSPALSSVYLLKMTSAGDTLWSGTYANGISTDLFNYGTGIQQISDTSYVTSAYSKDVIGFPGSLDMLVTSGRLQKNPYFYNSYSSIGTTRFLQGDSIVIDAKDIILDREANRYILGNNKNGNIFIAKISPGENVLSFKTFGTTALDLVSGFSRMADGGFIVAGSTLVNGNWDILVIRTDSNLSPIWTKTFGGTGDDTGSSAIQLADGSFIVSGTIAFGGNATGANNVMALIHIDPNGELK